jgi:hypothetical protein
MTGSFDLDNDLWIDVDASTLPAGFPRDACSTMTRCEEINGAYKAVTSINLTRYIRHLMRPDWLNAALTSSSANITIVGNTPTTGGEIG